MDVDRSISLFYIEFIRFVVQFKKEKRQNRIEAVITPSQYSIHT